MQETILSLKNIEKRFGITEILRGISLDIKKGEFITLLGPSGCGKTTTLRIIAGLETVDGGSVILNGHDITNTEPNERNVNTVFQNYALFPHMNVYDNIAYGPKIKKIDKALIKTRIKEMLALVKMEGFEKRMPDQISGGQRQRIAIARALINNPDIILLDEPLGALDLKLRQHMQSELKQLQRQTGVTFIYVTHDQDEALNMSDRIIIMNEGVIDQIGTPKEIYEKPRTKFVAQFVGEKNILDVSIIEPSNNKYYVDFNGARLLASPNTGDVYNPGEAAFLSINNDCISVSQTKLGERCLKGTVLESTYAGSKIKTSVELEGDFIIKILEYKSVCEWNSGDSVFLCFNPDNGILIKKGGA